ncbi:MAG: thiamine-phosphate kinase [Candidatus Terraquivivens tikiterensis]|uniref:Thiamine-monophosphate kinase n=1 Tax=Candidatus Terraquivivens tikiterensis TaxID=1980982 RepID=A0A2R7Y9C9_9ARCH|nr:MAG: thiamine-phosphate kinase [Candidatus Terraquivivens tikiterensis]
MSKRLKDIGEKSIVERILSRITLTPRHILPKGDDAIAFEFSGKLVVSTDMLVESTDVPPSMDMESVGWKALTMVVSDLAAKGATPIAYLISLGLPRDMRLEDFDALWNGLESAARHYGGTIAGGDTNEAKEIIVSCTGVGSAERVVPRGGARVGDILATTGLFGRSAAGLYALLKGAEGLDESLRRAVLRPMARLREGRVLAKYATSCIDSSDGLAASLYELAKQSGVGFEVTAPPVDGMARKLAEECGLDIFKLVFYGGEEYELVFTVGREDLEAVKNALNHVDGELIEIGRVVHTSEGITTIWEGKRIPIEYKGWDHFRM